MKNLDKKIIGFVCVLALIAIAVLAILFGMCIYYVEGGGGGIR